MITTSQAFKDEIKAPARRTAGRVFFSVVDPNSVGAATITVSEEAIISNKDQMKDEEFQTSGKYANFEYNYWKLDGSYVLPPKPTETSFQNGWWSQSLSDIDGNLNATASFTYPQDITSAGITIFFDILTDNYATDFVVNVYDAADSIIHTENVANNTDSKYILQTDLSNYRKIEIIVSKLNKPYRRLRILEVGAGLIEQFDGDKLINLNVLEEVDPISQEVTTNELSFTIDNENKRFNILNPDGIVEFLQRRQKITALIGAETVPESFEYVPMGVYYLKDWKTNKESLTASFTAYDILDIASESLYRKGSLATDTLYNLALEVLTDAAITEYNIDNSLQSINVIKYVPIITHREVLQLIASAGESVIYADREGVLQIKPLSTVAETYDIDFENSYRAPEVKLDKVINEIDVEVSSYSAEGTTETIYDDSLDINGTVEIWAEYSDPSINAVANVSGGTLNSVEYYTNAALLNITAAGTVNINITGNKLNISKTPVIIRDNDAPANEEVLTLKVSNSLISNAILANSVGNYVLQEVKKRNMYNVNWRQDPSLEIGDIVTVEDEFGVNANARVLKNNFKFSGSLKGNTELKGE